MNKSIDQLRNLRNTYPMPGDVQKLRESLGLTREDLAEMMGVSPRTVEGWELGRPIGGAARKILADLKTKTKKKDK